MNQADFSSQELDLLPLVKTLWKEKYFIAFATLGVSLVVAVFSMFIPNVYKSEAFLRCDMPSTKYKEHIYAFADIDRYASVVETKNIFTEQELKLVRAASKSPHYLSKMVEPLYADAPKKEPDPLADNSPDYILGFNVSNQSDSPEMARKYVISMAEFIKDFLLSDALTDYVGSNLAKASEAFRTIENSTYENNFALQQLGAKIEGVQKMKQKYPTTPIEIRQVFASQGQEYQYLSLNNEVIKIEYQIADLQGKQVGFSRDLEMAKIKYDYFSKANDILIKDKDRAGLVIFNDIQSMTEEFFKDKNLTKEVTKEIYNSFTTDLGRFRDKYVAGPQVGPIRFITGPTLSNQKVSPHRSLLVITSFLASGLFFVFFAFLKAWWKNNKQHVVGRDSKGDNDNENGDASSVMAPHHRSRLASTVVPVK